MHQTLDHLCFFEGFCGLICLDDCRLDYLDRDFLLSNEVLSEVDFSEATLSKRADFSVESKIPIKVESPSYESSGTLISLQRDELT